MTERVSEPVLSGALPVMWVITGVLAIAKGMVGELDKVIASHLPSWLALGCSVLFLSVISFMLGLPSWKRFFAGTLSAVLGAGCVLLLAASGSLWVVGVGLFVIVIPASRWVYYAIAPA